MGTESRFEPCRPLPIKGEIMIEWLWTFEFQEFTYMTLLNHILDGPYSWVVILVGFIALYKIAFRRHD